MNEPGDIDRWRLAEMGHQAAELVHQLRQPIFAIRGFVQLAQEDPSRATEWLAAADGQVALLESLVNGWSDFSRRPALVPEVVDLRASLDSALVLLRHRAGKIGVTIELVEGPSVGVITSRLALQQAVVNLGQNALDALAGREGARFQVRLEGASVVLSDNGPGLPPEIRAAPFTPFTTTKPGGTGLGLSIARALLERSGASLSLEDSAEGVTWRIGLAAAP